MTAGTQWKEWKVLMQGGGGRRGEKEKGKKRKSEKNRQMDRELGAIII